MRVKSNLLASLAVLRFLGALLYEVKPHDPIVFATVGALVGTVALLACALPAKRAARIDPVVSLRAE